MLESCLQACTQSSHPWEPISVVTLLILTIENSNLWSDWVFFQSIRLDLDWKQLKTIEIPVLRKIQVPIVKKIESCLNFVSIYNAIENLNQSKRWINK